MKMIDNTHKITVGTILRIPLQVEQVYANEYRVFVVIGVCLGGLNQESCYALRTLDLQDNDNVTKDFKELFVPCIFLDYNPSIEVMDFTKSEDANK